MQPYGALEETVRRNTLRLRNHPALAMWGGGNESPNPYGTAIDMMGRQAIELDGTRPFHRGEPWGGSQHPYYSWWGIQPFDDNLEIIADFLGEFGLASVPNLESVQRYLPAEELGSWPPADDGVFAYHMPLFNTANDFTRLQACASAFVEGFGESLEQFIIATQIAQGTGVRHTNEIARARYPLCGGSLYYKMNDNFPAVSWSTADWYGVAKLSHYIMQDSLAPLLAAVIVHDSFSCVGQQKSLEIVLFDDAGALEGGRWKVRVRAFNSELREVAQDSYSGAGSIGMLRKLGDFTLTAAQTNTTPLFIVTDVFVNDESRQRAFYFLNTEPNKGCIFRLPRTTLALETATETLTVKNTGTLPAVGVTFPCPRHSDHLLLEDSFFWLDPGECRTVRSNIVERDRRFGVERLR